MSQICYMAGYGINMNDLNSVLKEEYQELQSLDILEKIKDDIFCNFNGEDDYIYIPCVSPYEEPLFKSIVEIDNYFYDKLKPFLKEGVLVEHLSELLDDVFDWDYC